MFNGVETHYEREYMCPTQFLIDRRTFRKDLTQTCGYSDNREVQLIHSDLRSLLDVQRTAIANMVGLQNISLRKRIDCVK